MVDDRLPSDRRWEPQRHKAAAVVLRLGPIPVDPLRLPDRVGLPKHHRVLRGRRLRCRQGFRIGRLVPGLVLQCLAELADLLTKGLLSGLGLLPGLPVLRPGSPLIIELLVQIIQTMPELVLVRVRLLPHGGDLRRLRNLGPGLLDGVWDRRIRCDRRRPEWGSGPLIRKS
jgi:hypothetical protein